MHTVVEFGNLLIKTLVVAESVITFTTDPDIYMRNGPEPRTKCCNIGLCWEYPFSHDTDMMANCLVLYPWFSVIFLTFSQGLKCDKQHFCSTRENV